MHYLMAAQPYHLIFLQQVEAMIDDKLMYGFTIVVLIDIFTGITKGLRSKHISGKTNSTKGLAGLSKHLIIVIIVITAYPYLITLGFNLFAQLIVLSFIYQYLISIVENLNQMDIQTSWAQPIIALLAQKLNVAKAQNDYDPQEFNHLTGDYEGKKKEDK